MKKTDLISIQLILILLFLGAAGCSLSPNRATPTVPAAAEPTVTAEPIPEVTDTVQPTPTEAVAYAAAVNGEGIRQTSYDASLLQLQVALQTYPDMLPEGQTAQEAVIEQLVYRALLAQAAREAGFSATEEIVTQRLAQLTANAGGEEALDQWLAENGYSLETFLLELPLEIEAAWQRDQIAAAVPEVMEQVRAQQILFYDSFQASRAYDQLNAGFPFDQIAANNDPQSLGYLDWFPRGYLIFPEIEEAAFSLEPGQYSQVIETPAGYHILYVYEKAPAHPLSAEARLTLQEKAVSEWLTQQRSQSAVEVYLTP